LETVQDRRLITINHQQEVAWSFTN